MKYIDLALCMIALAAAAGAWLSVLKYNLHMFQLCGYKNDEWSVWLKKNAAKQRILYAAFLPIVATAFPMVSRILTILVSIILIINYLAYESSATKKKLVYTARVKRLIVTLVLIPAILMLLVILLRGKLFAWIAVRRFTLLSEIVILSVAMMPELIALANILNHPIEKAINNHYINDAKRILRQNPDLTVVGITGSYGKTSVKFYLQTLLSDFFNTLMTPESYNTPMGVVKTIRGSMSPQHEIFICEMGARHVGDIKEICDIVHPKHGILTSIGPQHLETFFNMENIISTKYELSDALPKDGILFVNDDNEYIHEELEKRTESGTGLPGEVVRYSAKAGDASYATSDIEVSPSGTQFTVTAPGGESERFATRLIGEHNVINIVGAISVAHRLGVPLGKLRIPVRRIQSVPHRLEMKHHGSVTIIDDAYNSNPVGSKAAVETLAMFDGIRILVTPGMVELGEKEEEYNRAFGGYAAKCCDYIILVGIERTRPIAEGAASAGFPAETLFAVDTLEEAMQRAYQVPGDGHRYILLENDLPDQY